jgi:hypothetical protein
MMFNLDESQWGVIRFTAVSAFAFWLFSQIADTGLVERLCNQVAVLTMGAGAIRIWMLEVAKPKRSR